MILVLDQSTDCAQMALIHEEVVHAAKSWSITRHGGDPLFRNWRLLFDESGIAPDAVEGIVVGLGPGNYTGLRVSLSAASLWALPGRIPVTGVSSSLAVAVAVARSAEDGDLPVIVTGDARRESIWMAYYPPPVGVHSAEQLPRIVSRCEWKLRTPAGKAVWVSSDWGSWADADLRARLPGKLIAEHVAPSPEILCRIALYRMRNGIESPPLKPIYLHPSVKINV